MESTGIVLLQLALYIISKHSRSNPMQPPYYSAALFRTFLIGPKPDGSPADL
jgi:hypothetical protein